MSLGCQELAGVSRQVGAGVWNPGSTIYKLYSESAVSHRLRAATPSDHRNILSGLALQPPGCLMYLALLFLKSQSTAGVILLKAHLNTACPPSSLLMNSMALRVHTAMYHGLRLWPTWPCYSDPTAVSLGDSTPNHVGSLTVPGTHQESSLPQALEPGALPHMNFLEGVSSPPSGLLSCPSFCEAFLLTPLNDTPFFPFFISLHQLLPLLIIL